MRSSLPRRIKIADRIAR